VGSDPLVGLLQFVVFVDPDRILLQIFEVLAVWGESFDFFQDLSHKLQVALVVSLKIEAERILAGLDTEILPSETCHVLCFA
jgi:hypothetical protein